MPAKKPKTRKTTAKKKTAVKRKPTTARKVSAKKKSTKTASAKKAGAKKSTTTKKATAKRTSAKKTTAKRATAKATTRKTVAKKATTTREATLTPNSIKVKEPMTQSQQVEAIAALTGLAKKDVKSVFEAQRILIEKHLRKTGPQQFTMPGLLKLIVKKRPATKARKGVNPFTGEPTTFKAKPASWKVAPRALKALKEMAQS